VATYFTNQLRPYDYKGSVVRVDHNFTATSRLFANTYGPPALGGESLSFLAALHGFTSEQMYEARRLLEVGAAALAAERASPDQVATLADEVACLFAAFDDPQLFLVHDITFHRGVAAASGNPIIASLMEMVSALFYEERRKTAARASVRQLRDAAEMHRRIYQAIRARDPEGARRTMNEHLTEASLQQAQEPQRPRRPRAAISRRQRPA
jgi:GntR family transcriptional regulator, transcriptional repressor for pyruvate dehydrogenase complex